MTLAQAIIECLRKYADFTGRGQRSEYWNWVLFIILGSVAIGAVETSINGFTGENVGLLNGAFSLATFLPGLSAVVRRLHDTNRSGWWWWIVFLPFIGAIILLVWLVSKGTNGPNDYGRDPLSDDPMQPRPKSDAKGLTRTHVPPVRRRK